MVARYTTSVYRLHEIRPIQFALRPLKHHVSYRRVPGLRRRVSTALVEQSIDIKYTRNIGIIAHIDAGKTTTTERMLYYSGHTRHLGNVDTGSTVTDFLPAERARGITIQSAAITFQWPPTKDGNASRMGDAGQLSMSSQPHHINLIDTPGHADFTFEVRRSLRILDGAICILDGVAGVEAQTEQVWKQAGDWEIPRIAYINKLDREGAAFGRTVREIALKLEGFPTICQIPWWDGGEARFCGVFDVVRLQGILYERGTDGKSLKRVNLDALDEEHPSLAEELRRARVALVELLSEHDDQLVEDFLEADEDHLLITPKQILASLRRCLLKKDCRLIPIFAGSSFRNIGVQPLLDAVNDLLPNPDERPDAEVKIGHVSGQLGQLLKGELVLQSNKSIIQKNKKSTAPISTKALKGCALAFKVVNDPRKGMLVYVRVYSGSIDRNATLFNTNSQVSERASTLLRMYASEAVPVQSIEAGQIGVIAGSKYARTGDTLIAMDGGKATPPSPLNQIQLRPIDVPTPVFFASVEPNTSREEKDMHEKLALLLREDPSLRVTQDEDTGQTLLSGMGELHLEIARDRLVNDLKTNATMGKIAIGYRETFTRPSALVSKVFDKDKADSRGKAGCAAMVQPFDNGIMDSGGATSFDYEQDGNIIRIHTPSLDDRGQPLHEESAPLPPHLDIKEVHSSLLNGALAALSRGPLYSYPVRGAQVDLTLVPDEHIFGVQSSYSALTAAARLATIAAFRDVAEDGVALMEPVMDVDISVDDSHLGNVIQDISSSRGGHIVSLGDTEEADALTQNARTIINVEKIYVPPDPFESGGPSQLVQTINIQRSVKARVPLKEMVGYLKHLRSMTGGRGTFVMTFDRFVKMTGQREKILKSELQGGM